MYVNQLVTLVFLEFVTMTEEAIRILEVSSPAQVCVIHNATASFVERAFNLNLATRNGSGMYYYST